MERRGRIPVAKFRTLEGKTRSRSRVREPDYNEQDPETDLFTLIEDNIALKEDNKGLKLQLEEGNKLQNDLTAENVKLTKELQEVKQQQEILQADLYDMNMKYDEVKKENNNLEKQYKTKVDKVTSMLHELKVSPSMDPLIPSQNLKSKLMKILPAMSCSTSRSNNAHNNSSDDMESILDVDALSVMPLTSDVIEQLTDEFLTMKNSLNAIELQLYEANEKISELLENQYHLEEENDTLRTENTNLTKVAKLLTQNMKESVETSKKMEAALFKLKERNEQLMSTNRDLIDGQPGNDYKLAINTGLQVAKTSEETCARNVEVSSSSRIADGGQNPARITGANQTENHNREQGERIVEMQSSLAAADANEELEYLRLRVQIMEEELRQALHRAETAEKQIKLYENATSSLPPPPPPPLPPPPPPMPSGLLHKPTAASNSQQLVDRATKILKRTQDTADDYKRLDSIKVLASKPEAAQGVDALVRELKSGRVTLRRRRRKTNTSEALQEMFQTLDISQRQNRNSKICINMNL